MNRYLVSIFSCALFLSLTITEASAGELLKCEKRTKPARSKISVEAEDLSSGALYTATVSSGNNSALASKAADVAGVIELDFDSNKNYILAGATAITAQFIGNKVSVLITDALGNKVYETTTACRVR